MASPHTPFQPSRDTFDSEELTAYDAVVARQKFYDYEKLVELVPPEHKQVVRETVLDAAGDEVDPDGRVQPYMGAMLNSPIVMRLISDLGAYFRARGETSDGYHHADREWVDMVLGEELQAWSIIYVHAFDAVAVGVRPQAIRALREGRDEDLTREELIKARYIRQVARGTVTPQSYGAIEDLFGRRGAVEYTAVIGWLTMTFRLIQAFGAQPGFTPEMVDDLVGRLEAGTVTLPDAKARVPGLEQG
jgi:hypothetical protein